MQSKESLFNNPEALNLEQYQALAQAQAEQNKGFGAQSNEVNWSSNIWTDNALKEAAGLYDSRQDLGAKPQNQSQQDV